MFNQLKNQKLALKIAMLGVIGVLITSIALVFVVVWQSDAYNKLAQNEVDDLVDADLNHITAGVYNMIRVADEATQKRVNYNLNIAACILERTGKPELSDEKIKWHAVNQFNNEKSEVELPRLLFGGEWLGQNYDSSVRTPVVDDILKITGDGATIFQVMNDKGDMIRVATTVEDDSGRRAIGTYIPAVEPDGKKNPVIAAIKKGETFHGRAYVVNQWYLTAYQPLYDKTGKLVGMLYVGVKLKVVEDLLRQAVLNTRVGKTGYVYIIGGEGEQKGMYIVSNKGERDGEFIWDNRDSDGKYVIREIVNRAVALTPGEMATIHYNWQNPGETLPRKKIARLAYYKPWDWVIGTSTYEDELDYYKVVLSGGRNDMVLSMVASSLMIIVIMGILSVMQAFNISKPVKDITEVAEKIINGNLDQIVDINTNDEIGTLAGTFNHMTQKLKETMEGLRTSEQKFKGIIENSSAGIFQTTLEGKILTANPALAEILGYNTPEEATNSLTDIRTQLYKNPEDRDILINAMKEKGAITNWEVEFQHHQKGSIWVNMSARLLKDDEGNPQYIEGFIVDITLRRIIEERLHNTNKQLEEIVDFLPDATMVIDNKRRIIAWNRAMEEMTGASKSEMIGKDRMEAMVWFYGYPRPCVMDLLFDDDVEIKATYDYIQHNGSSLFIEVNAPSLNKGKGAYVWATASPLFDKDGNVVGAIESIRDVTERKKAEADLKESEEMLRTLINAMPDIVCFKDGEGRWVEANDFDLHLFQLEGVPYKCKKDSELADYSDFYREAFLTCEDSDERAWAAGTVFRGDEVIPRPDGTSKTFDIIKVPTFKEDGTRKGLVVVGRDITERKKAEEALIHNQQELRRLNEELELRVVKRTEALKTINEELTKALVELKQTQSQLVESEKMAALGNLVAGVAHEINTPLGIGVTASSFVTDQVRIYKSLYEEGKLKKTDLEEMMKIVTETSEFILSNLNRASELIQSFKMVSVDQSSGERRAFRVKEYLGETLKSLRHKLKKGDFTVNITCPDELQLNSYPGAFYQIVSQLIMNSLTHGFGERKEGVIDVEVTADDRNVKMVFRDNGVGIAQENLKKIFDPFFSTRKDYGGSGLGLHIVYNLVTQTLGGRIRCESTPGEGTVFTITFPLSKAG